MTVNGLFARLRNVILMLTSGDIPVTVNGRPVEITSVSLEGSDGEYRCDIKISEKDNAPEPEPFFYCKFGGIGPICSDCKRNHINSVFATEEITTWFQPRSFGNGKRCDDYIKKQ